MKSLWNDADARAAVERYGAQGVGEDLARRTYSARLLGAEPTLVLHGGGNTSVKTTATDLFGDEVDVLCVKGSGWDLATIEPPGHPAVRLAPLQRLRTLDTLGDEAMVNAQRQNLLDSAAPNPSVETLLHAFLPEKFIDHTHPVAMLALADQPDAEAIIADLFGPRLACVPYVMPGFALAKRAVEVREAHPEAEGLVLLKHGLFSFGADARQSYERMIAFVTEAEAFVAKRRTVHPAPAKPTETLAPRALPMIRAALGKAAGEGPKRWLLDLRQTPEVMELVSHPDLAELSTRGVATPDHVIRTKRGPLVTPPLPADWSEWAADLDTAMAKFGSEYDAYFARQNARMGGGKTRLDPLPRLIAVPGLGLIGVGKSAGEAAVAADVGESWASTLLDAEAVGQFAPVGEDDTFDMEYWSLEQAKLGKGLEKRLARHVVVVTGGAGAIGLATAKAFAREGAEVAILDLDAEAAAAAAKSVSRHALGLDCDLTDAQAVNAAFDVVCARFGGIDIVVSNVGLALPGAMADLDDATLRRSFEANFFAHQQTAKAAISVFKAQGLGGALLFNVSKQALNPGAEFGAYGTSKAALLALMRQYALEHGADGVRVNALNPDRIRSGLLTDAMIAERSKARGLSEAAYMGGNLLGREVTAADVGEAFVFAALMRATTGAVITVDGGNVAAMVR